MSERSKPVSPLLSRLRTETRDQHDAIEHTLALLDGDLTRATYRQRLEQFYGFYKPVEDRLFGEGSPLEAWLDLKGRYKAPLLEADMKALDGQPAKEVLRCPDLPSLAGIAECFGCMYVLEGATLGGVLISRHIQRQLGMTASTGGLFFSGYGGRTGAMWQEFRVAINAFSLVTDRQDSIVASACTTFETLRHWCEARQADEQPNLRS